MWTTKKFQGQYFYDMKGITKIHKSIVSQKFEVTIILPTVDNG